MALDSTTALVLAMSGNRGGSNNMLLPLLLMSGGNLDMSQIMTPMNLIIGMSSMNPMMKMLVGGTGAMLAGTFLKPQRTYRRRTRTRYVYRNRYYRRRY